MPKVNRAGKAARTSMLIHTKFSGGFVISLSNYIRIPRLDLDQVIKTEDKLSVVNAAVVCNFRTPLGVSVDERAKAEG